MTWTWTAHTGTNGSARATVEAAGGYVAKVTSPVFQTEGEARAWVEAMTAGAVDEPKPRAEWFKEDGAWHAKWRGWAMTVWKLGVMWRVTVHGSPVLRDDFDSRDAAMAWAEAWADGRSERCGVRLRWDAFCVLEHGHDGDHAATAPEWTWTQRGGRSYGECGTVHATVWPDILPVAELYDATTGKPLAASTEAELPPYSTTDAQARAWCERTAREKGWTR